jgi:glycine/D-amino acid oxidase-like deaminating enzyme
MSGDEDYDVVVLGLGRAGAAAARVAARAGARVLVLERRGIGAAARARARAVTAAGAEVRPRSSAHEVLVEAGQVRGVGYLTGGRRGGPGLSGLLGRGLERVAEVLPSRPAAVLHRAAERLTADGAVARSVTCRAVVLGMGPSHWGFVGAAVWAASAAHAARMATNGTTRAASRSRRLAVVPDTAAGAVTPELSVRRWCAAREGGPAAIQEQQELQVDRRTGEITVGGAWSVPGLYAAVAAGPVPARSATEEARLPVLLEGGDTLLQVLGGHRHRLRHRLPLQGRLQAGG